MSLGVNAQCNTRSGYAIRGLEAIEDCGFIKPGRAMALLKQQQQEQRLLQQQRQQDGKVTED